MPRKKIFDIEPELLQKAIQMYNDGFRINRISKEICISTNTIKRALIEQGTYKEVPDMIEERNRNIILDHLENGLSFKQLSKKYNLCFSMIDQIVHEHLSDRTTLQAERLCIKELLDQGWTRDMIINNTVFPKNDTLHILNVITKRYLDQMTKDAIIDDYKNGEKIKTIMIDYHISQPMLYQIIDEGGVKRRKS